MGHKHKKFIISITPFILLYINPAILKKLLIYFQQYDNSPMYQDMDTLMNSYVTLRNQRKYNNLKFPSKHQIRRNEFQQVHKERYNKNFNNQINPNANTGSSNVNLT